MKIHIDVTTAKTYVLPFLEPDEDYNDATTAFEVYRAMITPLNVKQMNLGDSEWYQIGFATALAIAKDQQKIMDNPPDSFEALAIAQGFESAKEAFNLIAQVPIDDKFLRWKNHDGTKAGLLQLIRDSKSAK